jgi:putative ABC transport system permease protein
MTPSATDRVVRAAGALVPRRLRAAWRREWQAELDYGWQRLGARPALAARRTLTLRASSALAHAVWLRAQEMTMDPLIQDARFAVRLLRRHPGASFVAMLTLALGIGANTAIFSLVNTVLFKPLPVAGLDRLVVIREDLPGLNLLEADLAPVEVTDLAARDQLFSAVTGFRAGERTLTGFGDAARVGTAATVGDFAGVFGVRPPLGRFYGPDHSVAGPFAVAVVSHGLWQRLSGGDPAFLGRTIVLDDVPHEVVGVMPADFRYPRDAEVWHPFQMTGTWPTNRGSLFMSTVARLAPAVTEARLEDGLAREGARWNEEYFEGSFVKTLSAVGFVEHLAGPLRLILLVLLGAVMFVLLIAAANVASLQLVRTVGRAREIAVRSAIGAGRARIFRQFLIESVLLSAAGGLLGLGLGALALNLLEGWGPAAELHLTGIALDARVLAFTAGVTMLAAVAFGTLPALRGARVAPESVLREQGRGLSTSLAGNRLLRASIVVQIALALVLLLGSGLMIRTLSHLLAADPGFESAGLVTARVSVPAARYASNEQRALFFDEVLTRVRAMPGVESAALVTGLPFAGGNDSSPFDIPDRPGAEGEPRRHAEASAVSPGYFETMGIPILRGRAFDGSERPGTPVVAVIDKTFADQFFPGEDPVGRRITHYFGQGTPVEIVGVAGAVDHDEIADAPKALAYYSVAHQPWMTSRAVAIRTSEPAARAVASLRAAVAAIDPLVPLDDIATMEARIERSLGPRRLAMLALGGFSVLSLLLAALGVYGVMRYTTGQRTREIGVRMALGARPGEVVGLVVRQGLVVALLGVAIGTAVALASTRLMAGMLFGISPHDPATFVTGALVLLAVTVGASVLPAAGAARVDPVSALRSE